MFVQSNDLFFAPSAPGLALFDSQDRPVSGNVTSQISLWDAGTEQNEEPGVGAHTKPMQDPEAEDVGPKESEPVRLIGQTSDDYGYPSVASVIRVTVTPQ